MTEAWHPGRDLLARVFRGETVIAETEDVVAHLVRCRECWGIGAKIMADQEARGPLRQDALAAVVNLYRLEEEQLLEPLEGKAAWLEIRSLGPKTRREKVRLTRSLQTRGFVETLLSESRGATNPKESEELACLGLIVAEQLSHKKYSAGSLNSLAAECCAEIANARRRAAAWPGARKALSQAAEYLKKTANPMVEGQVLCVSGALEADLGHIAPAGKLLGEAVKLFERIPNWTLVGRTLVQLACVVCDAEPEEGLKYANQALSLIPPGNQRLTLFAEVARIDCLINLGDRREALLRFSALQELYDQFPEPFIQLRRRFNEARILECFGSMKKAEKVFLEVLAGDLEHGLVKDLFLDLVYLFGAYLKQGNLEGALEVCRRASRELALLDDEAGSERAAREQMGLVWSRLEQGIADGTVSAGIASALRNYVKTHWLIPADTLPI